MNNLALIDYPELPAALTVEEHDLLQQCEQIIRDGLDAFYSVANALATVNRRKLYREQYSTFKEYCVKELGMSKAEAYRMIDVDDVRENLSPLGDKILLPKKESHIRALKQAPPELQADIWSGVQMSGQPVTATRITQAVQEVLPKEDRPLCIICNTRRALADDDRCATCIVDEWKDKPHVIHTVGKDMKVNDTKAVIDDSSDLEPYIVTWLQDETDCDLKESEKLLHELIHSSNIVGDTPAKRLNVYLREQLTLTKKADMREACKSLEGRLALYYPAIDDRPRKTCVRCKREKPDHELSNQYPGLCILCADKYRKECERLKAAHEKLQIEPEHYEACANIEFGVLETYLKTVLTQCESKKEVYYRGMSDAFENVLGFVRMHIQQQG